MKIALVGICILRGQGGTNLRVGITNKKTTFNRKCFCCKSIINLTRHEHQDVVYFDNHYYHKECFVEMNGIKRKCSFCKKDIVVDNINDSKNVFYDSKYYHKDCFVSLCESIKNKKRKMALEHIDQFVNEANKNLEEIFNKRATKISSLGQYIEDANHAINDWFIKSDVNQFLIEQYGVVNLNRIYPEYLNKVYEGTYKHSLGIKIPPQHLLDMWQSKIKMLNDIYAKNIVKSKEMSAENRIVYDLAVLIRKYNSYLDWLNKQKVLEGISILSHIEPVVIHKKKNSNNEEKNEDINNLLDEIFA